MSEHLQGSLSTYIRGNCRCVACKQVMSEYAMARKGSLSDNELAARRKRKTELQRIRRAK